QLHVDGKIPIARGNCVMRRRDFIGAVAAAAALPIEARAQATEAATDNDTFSHFYADPRPARLLGFLDRYQKRAPSWNAFPPVAGFFAIVFQRHSDWIDRLVPEHPDSRTATAILGALRLSGLPSIEPNLRSRLSAAGADPTLSTELAN